MLVTLKNTAGGIYYKVYADHAKKELLLRTEDHQEAVDREILIVADIVTEWAANLEQRGPYATAQAKEYKDEQLHKYLKFTYGRGLAMLKVDTLCHELNYSVSTINQYLMSLRRRGAVSTKKIFNRKYIYIH